MVLSTPPPANSETSAGAVWAIIDRRIQAAINTSMSRWGKPRSRTVTINFPAAGTTTPVAGWIASVGISHNIKIVGWAINAIVPGQITLDLRVSSMQNSSTIQPTLTSLPGSSHFMTLNGYTAFSVDTSLWSSNQVSAGGILHVFVMSASTISQAILMLRVIDTDSKTLGT